MPEEDHASTGLGPYRDRLELLDSLYEVARGVGSKKPKDSEVVFVVGWPTTCDRYWHSLRETELECRQLPCTYKGDASSANFPKDDEASVKGFVDEVVGFTGTHDQFRHCTVLLTPDGFVFGIGRDAYIDNRRVADLYPGLSSPRQIFSYAGIRPDSEFLDPIFLSALEVSLVEPGVDVVLVNGRVVHLKEGKIMRSERVKGELQPSAAD